MLNQEPQIRLIVFIATLVLIALWEIAFPRRKRVASKAIRWLNNLLLTVFNTLVLRALFPALAVGIAVMADQRGWGLGNQIELPLIPWILFSIILLDLVVYFQHRIFHKLDWLWRLHRMHHIDPDLDVTSGSRFHPIEIALSMGIKMGVVILFGMPAIAVLIFEVVLNASAMFNHGNITIPLPIDRLIRSAIVTPDMHRVHHSVIHEETDSNFGFFLSWWDRLFGTYRDQPAEGHDHMTIGIGQFQDSKYLMLYWLLIVPFLNTRSSTQGK